MVEQITYNKEVLAIIIYRNYRKDGIEFFTPNNFSQQLAYMNRPKGYIIEPHVHNEVKREIHYTLEVLLIRKGKIRVDFYTAQKKYVESRVLQTGDVILLASGGHGFEMMEETEMIEVKQGPYSGEMDKTRFETIKPQEIKVRESRHDTGQ